MTQETQAARARGEVLRRRGVSLSRNGIERFFFARRQLLVADVRLARRLTLAECAARAKVGLRTLTRCLSGERVDRRSIELIFLGVGLEVQAQDVAGGLNEGLPRI